MSSRALRRLERSKGLSQDSELPEQEIIDQPTAPKVNAFALLNGSDESDEDVQDQDHDQHEDELHTEPIVKVQEVSNKSKKKAKRKGRDKKQVTGPDLEDLDDDDLDKYLAEVRKRDQQKLSAAAKEIEQVSDSEIEDPEIPFSETDPPIAYTDANYLYFTTERLKLCMHLLSIGTAKNLDPDTELKNLFGNLTLETIEDANSTTSLAVSPEVLAQFKKLARLTRGWGGKDHRSVPGTARKLLLTRIKGDWLPTAQKMLQMEDMTTQQAVDTKYYKEEDVEFYIVELKVKKEEKLGIRYFQFSKPLSIQDRVANTRFYASVVITPNPDALMTLLQLHPYHVENLLQVAMVMLRQGNNKATSNALVEKALFVFDRSFGKRFHELLQNGQTELIRLPYERFMNRQFYLTLFRTIAGLGERSTFFTALSYCKFLLALSPAEDPLGVRYFIDHYAILSEEYKYLVNFVDSALVSTYTQWFTPGLAFSKILALLHLNRMEDAKIALKKAVDAHPFCACELLNRISSAGQSSIKPADLDAGDAVVLAAETYLVRAPLLWKESSHVAFLITETTKLLDERVSNKSWLSKWFGSKSKTDDEPIPVNLLRFVLLSGENKVLAKVPHKVFDMEDTNEYDILPPRDRSVRYDVFKGESLHSVTDHLLDYMDHNLLGTVVAQGTAQFEDFDEEPVDGQN